MVARMLLERLTCADDTPASSSPRGSFVEIPGVLLRRAVRLELSDSEAGRAGREERGAWPSAFALTDHALSVRSMLARVTIVGAARRWIMKPNVTNGLSGFSASLVQLVQLAQFASSVQGA
ncbi:hypothetical protein AKJ09_08183 [Labilithrix luteola]|uniref:Uncharacterized protein n=1 Tax=Labilithrix luteola TaxID=1391654 RepID=A0A0K1Q7Y3_9BACT|nr:hypothetical protein AKJ09_08183 [Labilithrix luteola]